MPCSLSRGRAYFTVCRSSFVPEADEEILFLSINRYERKKNIQLAVEAFSQVKKELNAEAAARSRLIIAGGYDTRVQENVDVYEELMNAAKVRFSAFSRFLREANCLSMRCYVSVQANGLSTSPENICLAESLDNQSVMQKVLPKLFNEYYRSSGDKSAPTSEYDVGFLRSFTDEQKTFLLEHSVAVLYTPENEHFGIVPIECMAMARPVIAINSGGPRESIVHGQTGYLQESNPEVRV